MKKAFAHAALGIIAVLYTGQVWSARDNDFDACVKAARQRANGEIVKIEREEKSGTQVYEIDLKTQDGATFEIVCDAASHALLQVEHELPSAEHPAFAKLKKLSEEEAKVIALQAHPGKIEEVEYELEAGKAVYEFDIRLEDGRKFEVRVDAATGNILKAEQEDD